MLGFAGVVDVTESALDLRDTYLQAKIVKAKYSDDALHVALATVAGCALIVQLELPAHRPLSEDPPIQRHEYAQRLPADRDFFAAGGDPI